MVDERDHQAVRAHLHHGVGRVARLEELVLVQRGILIVAGERGFPGVFAGKHGDFTGLRTGIHDAQRGQLGVVHALDTHLFARDERGGVGIRVWDQAQQRADHEHHAGGDQRRFLAGFFHNFLLGRAPASGRWPPFFSKMRAAAWAAGGRGSKLSTIRAASPYRAASKISTQSSPLPREGGTNRFSPATGYTPNIFSSPVRGSIQ